VLPSPLLGFLYRKKGLQGGSEAYASSPVGVMSVADADPLDFSGGVSEAFWGGGACEGHVFRVLGRVKVCHWEGRDE